MTGCQVSGSPALTPDPEQHLQGRRGWDGLWVKRAGLPDGRERERNLRGDRLGGKKQSDVYQAVDLRVQDGLGGAGRLRQH